MDKIRIEQHSCLGLIWAAGWLFTLGFLKLGTPAASIPLDNGYLKLGFWQGVLAIVIWPYDIGAWVATLIA